VVVETGEQLSHEKGERERERERERKREREREGEREREREGESEGRSGSFLRGLEGHPTPSCEGVSTDDQSERKREDQRGERKW
jgi:hypothetical protein